jgi:hypothetical protein
MLVGKTFSLPLSEASERYCTQVGKGLTHKQLTRLERLARVIHSSLLQTFGLKKFYDIGPAFAVNQT